MASPPKSIPELAPNNDQRGLIVGLSGGGKSFLAYYLNKYRASRQDLLIIDPKREIEFKNAIVFQNPNDLAKLFKRYRGKRTVYQFRPSVDDFSNPNAYNTVLRAAFERQDISIYIDELTCFCTSNQSPPYLRACYNMGRSQRVSMLSCTQRPVGVPLYCVSESNRFYIFPLNLEDDRKKVKGYVKGYDPDGFDEVYSFYYYDTTKPGTVASLEVLRTRK